MGQFQCRTKNNSRKRDLLSNINYNHDTLIRIYKQGYKLNKVLMLLNDHGNISFLFENLSSYNINNQWAKVDKNLSADSISVQ